MAEDEDGVSDKNSPQNSNNTSSSQDNKQNTTKPDLGIEEAKYDIQENGDTAVAEPSKSTSKSTGAIRKEENPFSFRHFLKRDLSLPGNSTYENTGARPKVYANTVQHSPTKLDIHSESRRDKTRSSEPQAKERQSDIYHSSDHASSSSSVELPYSVADNSDSKHNLYSNSSDGPFFHRPNLASEPLGMPSLPDFVQDHLLVEQAYSNSNGPISVDLDNLPDFTFNTSFNSGSPVGRHKKQSYSNNRGYDYNPYDGERSEAGSSRNIPLDLPEGAAGPVPLDLGLNLDLTESVNQSDRRNVSPRNSFPLDLPPNAGAESRRLPDLMPVHPGRTSPEPEHQDEQLQQIISELERARSDLFAERSRRSRAEDEAQRAREELAAVRAELAAVRLRPETHQAGGEDGTLRAEVRRLQEQLNASRAVRTDAAAQLRRAAEVAELQLRDLLAGLDQLKSLSSSLEPT
ncbi:uncharacterized protein LOC121738915 [Aricia agestis]|uniref:uncharacterized protein LOC121738915 n=1 Tax=Aricia agestis TaxID=91739 RepID=UPI001C205B40|nr:uncharacterized protein LOC121738915 [Aricia agestis]